MTKSDAMSRDYDLIKGRENVEVCFTITSLADIPEWVPEALGNKRRIETEKKVHDLRIKTFVSMEPTIPGK
jgi:DNA repair photolyase